jgi:hypothetical protein
MAWQRTKTEEARIRRSENLFARRAQEQQQQAMVQSMAKMMEAMTTTMATPARPRPFAPPGARRTWPLEGKGKGNGKGQGKGNQPASTVDASGPATGYCSKCRTAHHAVKPPRFCRMASCGGTVVPVGGGGPIKPVQQGDAAARDQQAPAGQAGTAIATPPTKPLVSIPPTIAAARTAAENFVAKAASTNSTTASVDVEMELEPAASPELLKLQAQLLDFAPGGVLANAAVHKLLLEQVAAVEKSTIATAAKEYTKHAHHDAAQRILKHKKWVYDEMRKEEAEVASAEKATAERRARLAGHRADMDAWFLQAETAISLAAAHVDPPVNGICVLPQPATQQTANAAQNLSNMLESTKATRAAKVHARQGEMGRPLTAEEIFVIADNECSLASVAALAAVNWVVAAPIMTAVPEDIGEADALRAAWGGLANTRALA